MWTYWRSLDVAVLSSVVVWELALPEVGVVLSSGVQLVPPRIEPVLREREEHKHRETRSGQMKVCQT